MYEIVNAQFIKLRGQLDVFENIEIYPLEFCSTVTAMNSETWLDKFRLLTVILFFQC